MFRVPAGVKQIRLKLSPYSPKTLAVSQVLDKIVTDGDAQYSFIVPKEKHVAKSHAKELWETGTISNKTIEGAFSLFKRGVVGAYRDTYGRRHETRFCDYYHVSDGVQPLVEGFQKNIAAPLEYNKAT